MMNFYKLPEYNTVLFSEVFPSLEEFVLKLSDVNPRNSEDDGNILFNGMSDNDLILTYFLLSTEYGEAPINSDSINHFILKTAAIINNYGPIWAKKRKLRDELQAEVDVETLAKDKMVHNYADNPATRYTGGELEEGELIKFINSQSASMSVPSKIKAYEHYVDYFDSITNNLDRAYLDKFKVLFLRCVLPQKPLLYVTDEEDN